MADGAENDRNYSFEDIEIDPRFRTCESEMKLTFGVWIAYMIVSVALCYFLGRGDPANYTYLWGVPLWMAIGAWLTTAVFFVVVVFIALFVFKNMDISK